MNRTFEDSDLMAHSQDLELEVKARTKYRTQCDEKCEQASGHRRREFAKQYNSFPPRSFRVFERHIGECEMGNARQSNAPSVRSSEFGVCSVGDALQPGTAYPTTLVVGMTGWSANSLRGKHGQYIRKRS